MGGKTKEGGGGNSGSGNGIAMLNTVQLFQLPAKMDQFLKTLQTVLNPLVLEKNKLRFFASLNFKDYIS